MKFHENPSRRNKIPCGRTDMTKVKVAFANAPENVKCEIVNTRLLDPVTRARLNSTNA
jgi:hypothetical protein